MRWKDCWPSCAVRRPIDAIVNAYALFSWRFVKVFKNLFDFSHDLLLYFPPIVAHGRSVVWGGVMKRLVSLQFSLVMATSLMAGLLAGQTGAISAALGGFSCLIPNLWLWLRLSARCKGDNGVSPMSFFIGEFLKVAATIGLLAAAIRLYPALHWPSFLAGLVLAVQANFFAFCRKN
ncbi:MAG: ATP synthase subunit I [Zoogloeaceae bacterium]|jgi:ATP synthase protein I|nr:ATP synthase subunit I [Zoogloeaceae bacterium]